MYSYKLNNAYTVYVNYAYLNDCIKASKKRKGTVLSRTYVAPKKKDKREFAPLPIGTILSHRVFGCGKVVSMDNNGVMCVAFENKKAKFIYPDAVKRGFLALAQ